MNLGGNTPPLPPSTERQSEPLRKSIRYLERAIDRIADEMADPTVDYEAYKQMAYVLTQLISTLVKAKKAMGEEPSEDERLIDLVNKAPLIVAKNVERE
ncbi:MAG: hypothetical protein ACE5Z5_15250, partial [Candidatus Bathyarchaeia archaeon]